MIRIVVNSEIFSYDMYHIVKAFYPNESYEQVLDETNEYAVHIETRVFGNVQWFIVQENEIDAFKERKAKKRYVNLKLYDWLKEQTSKELAWGILTGVRPTKLMMNLLESGMSDDEVESWMKENYGITDAKAQLGLAVAKKEKALLEQLDYENGYSLYIGIPFCPSICSYCSFSSYPIGLWKKRVDEYLDAVCKELSFIGEKAKQNNKTLNTVYIGGGTPTTLEAEQLDRLLTHLEQNFSFAELKEITVEAGRPDSIT